jgi:hypothetical protein
MRLKSKVVAAMSVVLLITPRLVATTHFHEPAHEVVVYKTARCECCAGWAEHMRKAGYVVTTHDLKAADRIKKQEELGVPPSLSACHTSIVDGYVVQGHVPASDVDRLLKERPKIVGIGVYHMPAGSPGMESDTPEPYQVIAFTADSTWIYAKH